MKNLPPHRALAGLLVFATLASARIASAAGAADVCRVVVTDQESGWPVLLVELRTAHHMRFVTGNAGVITLVVGAREAI